MWIVYFFVDYQGWRGTCRSEWSGKAVQYPWGLRWWRLALIMGGNYVSREDWTLAVIATLFKTQMIMHTKLDVQCKLCHVAEIFSYLKFISAAPFLVCPFFVYLIVLLFSFSFFFFIQEKSPSYLPAMPKPVWLYICFPHQAENVKYG